MKKATSKRTGRARYKARAKARSAVIRASGEEMFALIRLHVLGCPQCELRLCDEAMHDFLDRFEHTLNTAAKQTVASTRAPAARKRAPAVNRRDRSEDRSSR